MYGLFAPLHKIVVSSLPLPARYQSQSQQEDEMLDSVNTFGSCSSLSSISSALSGSSFALKALSPSTSQVYFDFFSFQVSQVALRFVATVSLYTCQILFFGIEILVHVRWLVYIMIGDLLRKECTQ